MLAPHPPSGTHHRGYSAPGIEQVAKSVNISEGSESLPTTSDIKESFECGKEDDSLMPNIWLPEDVLPGFREVCLDFYWTCYELEKHILRALAIAFDLAEDYFMPFHRKVDNQLRLLHYPSVSYQHGEDLSRIAAHTDYDTFTLLFQDDVGGLEVEDPHRPGIFVLHHGKDITTVVDTIPGTWSVDNPKKYEPISAMDYVMKRLAAAY
ncbi:hypothetical protein H1R20_g9337, partial [Candolleomyces eurysporus]